MARGKYAVRARNKADADARWQAAQVETDRLRSRVVQLRRLEAENANLRAEVADLSRQLANGQAELIEKTEKAVAEAKATTERNLEMLRLTLRAAFDCSVEFLRGAGVRSRSREWWRVMEPYLVFFTGADDDWLGKRTKFDVPMTPAEKAAAKLSLERYFRARDRQAVTGITAG